MNITSNFIMNNQPNFGARIKVAPLVEGVSALTVSALSPGAAGLSGSAVLGANNSRRCSG